MAVGKIYFARVEYAGVPFNAALHAREDLTIFSADFSQVRGQAGSITVEILSPMGGLMSGPRWGILSAEIDGVVTQIARGEIIGFPLALAGDTISVELSCKGPHTSEVADGLFRAHDHTVPRHVDASTDPRRSGDGEDRRKSRRQTPGQAHDDA